MRSLAFGLALAMWAHVAHAQSHDKASAEKAYVEGQALYNAGDYRAAADQFKLAYDRDPDPVYLFNLAQADRFAKHCADAADAYRRFLAAAPTAPNFDKVQKYIAEMDACAHDQELAEPAPAPAPVERAPAPIVTPNPRHNSIATEVHATPRPADHRTTIYALGGAGIVAVGVGAYFTYDLIDAKSSQSQCQTSHQCDGKTYQDLDDRGSRADWAVPVSFGLAAAALGTATWLYFHDRTAAQHALAVAPTRGGAYVSAALRF